MSRSHCFIFWKLPELNVRFITFHLLFASLLLSGKSLQYEKGNMLTQFMSSQAENNTLLSIHFSILPRVKLRRKHSKDELRLLLSWAALMRRAVKNVSKISRRKRGTKDGIGGLLGTRFSNQRNYRSPSRYEDRNTEDNYSGDISPTLPEFFGQESFGPSGYIPSEGLLEGGVGRLFDEGDGSYSRLPVRQQDTTQSHSPLEDIQEVDSTSSEQPFPIGYPSDVPRFILNQPILPVPDYSLNNETEYPNNRSFLDYGGSIDDNNNRTNFFYESVEGETSPGRNIPSRFPRTRKNFTSPLPALSNVTFMSFSTEPSPTNASRKELHEQLLTTERLLEYTAKSNYIASSSIDDSKVTTMLIATTGNVSSSTTHQQVSTIVSALMSNISISTNASVTSQPSFDTTNNLRYIILAILLPVAIFKTLIVWKMARKSNRRIHPEDMSSRNLRLRTRDPGSGSSGRSSQCLATSGSCSGVSVAWQERETPRTPP